MEHKSGQTPENPPRAPWRDQLAEVIFGTETPAGRLFDLALIGFIVLSSLVVMLESVEPLRRGREFWFNAVEWCFTGIFTIEFVLRLLAVHRPKRYLKSFFGVVDMLALLPSYVALILPGAKYLYMIRLLRMFRLLRILKLARYITEAEALWLGLKRSGRKICVFMGVVLAIVLFMGTLLYLVEGERNGFTSIPRSMYWAVVTMTTVGYGDIAPKTVLGQFLASILMLTGFAIIAVPTGIVSMEISAATRAAKACPMHPEAVSRPEANFCHICGRPLERRS